MYGSTVRKIAFSNFPRDVQLKIHSSLNTDLG